MSADNELSAKLNRRRERDDALEQVRNYSQCNSKEILCLLLLKTLLSRARKCQILTGQLVLVFTPSFPSLAASK